MVRTKAEENAWGTVAKIIAIIAAILCILAGVNGLLGMVTLDVGPAGEGAGGFLTGTALAIISIVVGAVVLAIEFGKILNMPEYILLAVLYIVLGIFAAGGIILIIAGIIYIIAAVVK